MATPNERSSSGIVTTLLVVLAPISAAAWIVRRGASSTIDQLASSDARALAEGLTNTVIWGLTAGVIVALTLLFFRLRSMKSGCAEIETVLEQIATGNIDATTTLLTDAGLLSDAAATSLAKIGSNFTTGREGVGGQKAVLESLGSALTSVAESLAQQSDSLLRVVKSVGHARSFLTTVSEHVDGLGRGTEETSSSILEMVAINNEVGENIHNLAQSVQETTTAIEEMTFSVKEVARNIEELSTAAEETAASMNQMDVSIGQVEANANETARLSETVTTDAETGVSAIAKTIVGIDRIKNSSKIASEAIGILGERINEIGNILTVIDDVAEQTNLLALNAAIIAAQAGEHGRGFAVVADEIKALAERTGASTKEIAELIKTVQAESKNAITVMSTGVDAVAEGVELGHNAEEALMKIVDSAKRSTLMIKAIARATVEQAKGSKQVTNAISRIAETVQQIALATSEQAKGSEQIMKSAERMRIITQQVERSTEEQNRGGRQVTESIERIRTVVERVNDNHSDLIRNNEELSNAANGASEATGDARTACSDAERFLAESAESADRIAATFRA